MAQLLFKKPEEVDSHLKQLHVYSEAFQPIYIVCFGDSIYLRGKSSKKWEDVFILIIVMATPILHVHKTIDI